MINLKNFHPLLKFLTYCLVLFSFFNLIPTKYWLQNLSREFSLYYLFLHLVCILLLVFYPYFKSNLKRLLFLALQIFIAIYYFLDIYPFYFYNNTFQVSENKQSLKVLYANLNSANRRFDLFSNLIEKEEPEVLALVEFSTPWKQALKLEKEYLYKQEVVRDDNFGIALYSKFPIIKNYYMDLGENLPPVIKSQIRVTEKQVVNFVVFHALPPVSLDLYRLDQLLFRRLITDLRHDPNNVILAGDFNAGPFSYQYKLLEEKTSLKNSSYGWGMKKTWNVESAIFHLTIDHLFNSKNLNVVSYQVLDDIGSDHYPILANYNFKN